MPFKYTITAATSDPQKADKMFAFAKELGIYVNILESIKVEHGRESSR